MANITLLQQAESASNRTNTCTVTLENCTVGSILILAYAVRGTDNVVTLPSGWVDIGGGNVFTGSTNQHMRFARSVVGNETETVTVTQSGTSRMNLVLGEFAGPYYGAFTLFVRNDMASKGAANFSANVSKTKDSDIILYAVSSFSYSGEGRLQTCDPDDLEKLQGDSTMELLACWFDNGTGATAHTFKTCDATNTQPAIVECLQFVPKTYKYLVRDNDVIYTVEDDQLVAVPGELSAQMFLAHGVDEVEGDHPYNVFPYGDLLASLESPEVLCWTNSGSLPELSATVQGQPTEPHSVISGNIQLDHETIYGILNVDVNASDGVEYSLSFNGGEYMVYNSIEDNWVASDTGMSASELMAVPVDAWSSVVNSATYMKLKATLDGTETVTQVRFDFNNESPTDVEGESEV